MDEIYHMRGNSADIATLLSNKEIIDKKSYSVSKYETIKT